MTVTPERILCGFVSIRLCLKSAVGFSWRREKALDNSLQSTRVLNLATSKLNVSRVWSRTILTPLWSVCGACLCQWPCVFSNVNPLVRLTPQWRSGHFISIFCGFSQRWGCLCQGDSRQQQQQQQKQSVKLVLHQTKCIQKHISFLPPFLGLESASPMPVAARGMSVILARGNVLFQGRQLIKVSDKCWGGNDSLFCPEVKSCTL